MLTLQRRPSGPIFIPSFVHKPLRVLNFCKLPHELAVLDQPLSLNLIVEFTPETGRLYDAGAARVDVSLGVEDAVVVTDLLLDVQHVGGAVAPAHPRFHKIISLGLVSYTEHTVIIECLRDSSTTAGYPNPQRPVNPPTHQLP